MGRLNLLRYWSSKVYLIIYFGFPGSLVKLVCVWFLFVLCFVFIERVKFNSASCVLNQLVFMSPKFKSPL